MILEYKSIRDNKLTFKHIKTHQNHIKIAQFQKFTKISNLISKMLIPEYKIFISISNISNNFPMQTIITNDTHIVQFPFKNIYHVKHLHHTSILHHIDTAHLFKIN